MKIGFLGPFIEFLFVFIYIPTKLIIHKKQKELLNHSLHVVWLTNCKIEISLDNSALEIGETQFFTFTVPYFLTLVPSPCHKNVTPSHCVKIQGHIFCSY